MLPLLSSIMYGHQQQGHMFGRGLAKGSNYAEKHFRDILAVLGTIGFEERNSAVLGGWLSALDDVAPERVDVALAEIADLANLRSSVPSICRGIKLNDSRVKQLIGLLQVGAITPSQLHGISYGQSMNAVSPAVVSELCRRVLTKKAEGAWVALDIAFMFVFGDSEKWSALAPTLREIISTEGMLRKTKHERQLDAHAFAKVAEKLIENDQELAAILTTEIIATITQDTHAVEINHCLAEVLTALLEKQLAATWPQIADALMSEDGLTQWRLGHLLGGRLGEVGNAGLIGKLPNEYLVRWCADAPHAAPRILAEMVQIMELREDKWILSDMANFLLDNYGNDSSVLSGLGVNMGSFSWSGSLVPYYERQISVMQPLKEHPRVEVRQWAERRIESALRQAKQEMDRDQEKEIGRYS